MKNFLLVLILIQSYIAKSQNYFYPHPIFQLTANESLPSFNFSSNQKTSVSLDYRMTHYTIEKKISSEWQNYLDFSFFYSGDRGGTYNHEIIPFSRGAINFDVSYEQFWDEDIYTPIYEKTRIYDPNNLVVLETTNSWNADFINYEYYQQEIFMNEENKLIQKNKNEWNGSAYDSIFEIDYAYSGEYVSYRLNKSYNAGIFEDNTQTFLHYDLEGNYSDIDIQLWDGSVWNNDLKYFYSYNLDATLSTVLVQKNFGAGLENYYQIIYTYLSGVLQSFQIQIAESGIFVNDTFVTVDWNAEGNLNQLIYQTWDGSNYIDDLKYQFTYEMFETNAIENNASTKLEIYPNPASEILTITADEMLLHYKLISMDNSMLATQNINDKNFTIHLSEYNLSKGIYLLLIETESALITKKLILQ